MAIGINDQSANELLRRLKKQSVRMDEVQIGDIVDSDPPFEVRGISHENGYISLSDVDENSWEGGPLDEMIRIVDRSLLLAFEPEESDEELEEE